MDAFIVQTKGLKEFARRARDYPKVSGPIVAKAMVAVPAILAKHTLKENPVPFRTGNLLQSFRQRVSAKQAVWYPTARYAAMVEYGTRPHRIYAKNGRALHWTSGGTAGRYVTTGSGRRRYQSGKAGSSNFARYVNHPGTRPKPYMQKILDNSIPDLNSLFDQANEKITRELLGGV